MKLGLTYNFSGGKATCQCFLPAKFRQRECRHLRGRPATAAFESPDIGDRPAAISTNSPPGSNGV